MRVGATDSVPEASTHTARPASGGVVDTDGPLDGATQYASSRGTATTQVQWPAPVAGSTSRVGPETVPAGHCQSTVTGSAATARACCTAASVGSTGGRGVAAEARAPTIASHVGSPGVAAHAARAAAAGAASEGDGYSAVCGGAFV